MVPPKPPNPKAPNPKLPNPKPPNPQTLNPQTLNPKPPNPKPPNPLLELNPNMGPTGPPPGKGRLGGLMELQRRGHQLQPEAPVHRPRPSLEWV